MESQSTLQQTLKKPDWIRVKAPTSQAYKQTEAMVNNLKLNTVCQEAACPNIGECWAKKHVTVMILGSVCTRACAFCNIKTGRPDLLDPHEPERLAKMVAESDLNHVVITSVDRDDLPDGGASQFVACIEQIRAKMAGRAHKTTIEILTPDFRGKNHAIDIVAKAGPDVYNHNLETVPSLYQKIRPGARYFGSLRLLQRVKEVSPTIFTKSGLMVGLGEYREEILQVMDDMRSAGVDFLTIGQYLQPTKKHADVKEFVTPDIFKFYEKMAYAKGFLLVSSSPLTRSSYHADSDFEKLQQARIAAASSAKVSV